MNEQWTFRQLKGIEVYGDWFKIEDPRGNDVAWVPDEGSPTRDDEQRAILLAAVPQLLAACAEARNELANMRPKPRCLESLQAAIMEATRIPTSTRVV